MEQYPNILFQYNCGSLNLIHVNEAASEYKQKITHIRYAQVQKFKYIITFGNLFKHINLCFIIQHQSIDL